MVKPELNIVIEKNEWPVASTDASGVITNANQKFIELTGYSLTELKTLAYTDITPEQWTVYENKMVIKEVFTKGHAYYQKEYLTKAGKTIPIELDVYLTKANSGELQGMWAIVKPIDTLDEEFSSIKLS